MVLALPALWPTAGKVGGSPKTSQWERGGIDDDTAPMSEAEKTQGAAIPSVPEIQRRSISRQAQAVQWAITQRAGTKGSEPERGTVTWY